MRGSSLCSCDLWLFLWPGRCEGLTRKVNGLPTLKGEPHAVASPATRSDLLGARTERVPDCSSYLSRIPWSATDSGLSIHPRVSVDRAAGQYGHRRLHPFGESVQMWAEPTRAHLHAILNASAASESTTAGSLKAASLSAGAASESTTTGGLEALSELRWSRELENACPGFRCNQGTPSP